MSVLWSISGWMLDVGLSTLAFFIFLYLAHLVALEVPTDGRLLLVAGLTQLVAHVPSLIFLFVRPDSYPAIIIVAAVLSYFVLAWALTHWGNLLAFKAIYVTLLAALMYGVFSVAVLA